MDALYLEKTEDSPKVLLEPNSGQLLIEGRSFMEDTAPYQEAIVEWLREYFRNPQKITILDLQMEYMNTSSSKMILDILFEINKFYIFGNEVVVRWMSDQGDEDIREAGHEFAEMIDIPFEYVVFL